MAFLKITKSAKRLKRSAIEYLDKDKDHLTKSQIEYNKLKAKYKSDPSDSLKKKILDLRKKITNQKREWRLKDQSDIRLSGYLRKTLYKSGYRKLVNKEDQIKLRQCKIMGVI